MSSRSADEPIDRGTTRRKIPRWLGISSIMLLPLIVLVVIVVTNPVLKLWPNSLLDSTVCGSWGAVLGPQDSLTKDVGQRYGGFQRMAAIRANDIWVVGDIGVEPLVEHWDGSGWNRVAAPNPQDSTDTSINGIAAIAHDDIWSVGTYFKGQGTPSQWTVTWHYDGRTWGIVPSPNPGLKRNALTSVAALSADDVWAVGYYGINEPDDRLLLMHWDGKSWAMVAAPDLRSGTDRTEPSHSALYDVIALSPEDVWAVGEYAGASHQGGLAVHWDGHNWSMTPVPRRPGHGDIDLRAVTATSSRDVWAVGAGWYREAIIVHWDGNEWSTISSPFGEEEDRGLLDVEALAPNNVWAVGRMGALPYRTLVLHWNGVRWGTVESPNPMRNNLFLGIAALAGKELWVLGTATDNVFKPDKAGSPSYPFITRYSPVSCPTPLPTGP